MGLVGLLPFQAEVTFTAVHVEILTNPTITIRQKHCGNLLGTEKPLLPTACSSHKTFNRVNHYPFFQNHSVANVLSETALTLTSILFFYQNQAFLFITFITICLPRTFETFYCLICSILPPNPLVLLLPSPTLFSFEPYCASPQRVCLKSLLDCSFLCDLTRGVGVGEIHTALECLWNGSEGKGLTGRNVTGWTVCEATWLEKLPTGFLFPSSKVRNSYQLGGLRFFSFF